MSDLDAVCRHELAGTSGASFAGVRSGDVGQDCDFKIARIIDVLEVRVRFVRSGVKTRTRLNGRIADDFKAAVSDGRGVTGG